MVVYAGGGFPSGRNGGVKFFASECAAVGFYSTRKWPGWVWKAAIAGLETARSATLVRRSNLRLNRLRSFRGNMTKAADGA